MTQKEAEKDLVGVDRSGFERALRRTADAAAAEPEQAAGILAEAVRGVDGAKGLSERERGRRIQLLLRQGALSDGQLSEVATRCGQLRPSSKNALRARLPAHLRQALAVRTQGSDAGAVATERDSTESILKHRSLTPREDDTREDDGSPFRTVLLVGSQAEHAPNASLLANQGFAVLRSADCSRLDEFVESNICGVVVARSCWLGAPPDQHRDLVTRLFGLSSVIFVRVDVDGLDNAVASELLDLYREIRCADARTSTFCHGSGSRLTSADSAALDGVANLLSFSSVTRYQPDEIESSESLLLRVAATEHVRGSRNDYRLKLEEIKTSFFKHGRSDAKTVLVRPDDGNAGFVVKLDRAERLRSEIRAFQKYVSRWDGRTQPHLYFHGQAAAVVFSLFDSAHDPGLPAPTLHDCLERLVNSELGDWGGQTPNEDDIEGALNLAAKKLAALNADRPPQDAVPARYDWMLASVRSLENAGIAWKLEDADGESFRLTDVMEQASAVVSKLAASAIVHGDVHLMNVLVSDDREPFLIDYANCGPGHPCYDLVRLEAAVAFRCFRSLTPEPELVRLMKAIAIDGADFGKIQASFGDLTTSVGNRLSIKLAIEVRKRCLELLSDHDGGLSDYLAMKMIVSGFALTLLDPQAAVARAAASALAPHLRTAAASG